MNLVPLCVYGGPRFHRRTKNCDSPASVCTHRVKLEGLVVFYEFPICNEVKEQLLDQTVYFAEADDQFFFYVPYSTGRFDAGDNWYGYIAPAEAVQIQGRYYFGFLPYQPALYGAIPARRSEPRVTARQVLDPESPVVLQARS